MTWRVVGKRESIGIWDVQTDEDTRQRPQVVGGWVSEFGLRSRSIGTIKVLSPGITPPTLVPETSVYGPRAGMVIDDPGTYPVMKRRKMSQKGRHFVPTITQELESTQHSWVTLLCWRRDSCHGSGKSQSTRPIRTERNSRVCVWRVKMVDLDKECRHTKDGRDSRSGESGEWIWWFLTEDSPEDGT